MEYFKDLSYKIINKFSNKLFNMKKKNKIKISSNKSFGIVFFIVFLIISIWPLINDDPIRVWAAFISFIFLSLAIFKSKILSPLNYLWFKIGMLLGAIVSPIVMAIVFFIVVTPIALLMKAVGKDVIKKKFNNNIKSYWIKRSNQITSMKEQF